jgi:hypothetical protein
VLGILGILLSLALLMYLAYRGVNVLLLNRVYFEKRSFSSSGSSRSLTQSRSATVQGS